MAENRHKIIIQEIEHWKKNKLLPVEYCDYLLALYTQGEGSNSEQKQGNILLFIYITILLLLLPLSFLFTAVFPISLLIKLSVLTSIFILSVILYISFFRNKEGILQYFSLIISFMLSLFILTFISQELQVDELLITMLFIITFMGWLSFSMAKKYKILSFISLLGILFTVFNRLL
ncbi:hypothetical protein AB4Y30_10055 [Ornithinibacillus sp. 4-3]|uniref:DUF1129 domain-containing protein n=1 Tax=Ornithinibacillus sp. 4-3 TaxID=3231488 RepID=A0AB39HLT2_9BACI